MALYFWYLVKKVYACTAAYTGQVTFYKVPLNTAMFIWTGCTIYNISEMREDVKKVLPH